MNEGIPVLVSLIGLTVAGIGLLGIAAPTRLTSLLNDRRGLTGLPVTFAVRIVTGSIFVIAAQECRVPTLVRLIGYLEFGGAAVLLTLGAERLGRFVEWWLRRSSSFVQYWCLGAFALGMALLYSGA
ncbi:MAG: hypothetical protein JRG80_02935 [Deltaproteobacteria bacterium]|nr:hypothetical protein [Deltaproteobacteria bacterium]MBW2398209.1 hypothetical protein [Deltaproteobacteria bacterium]